jgi:hypothetical protein
MSNAQIKTSDLQNARAFFAANLEGVAAEAAHKATNVERAKAAERNTAWAAYDVLAFVASDAREAEGEAMAKALAEAASWAEGSIAVAAQRGRLMATVYYGTLAALGHSEREAASPLSIVAKAERAALKEAKAEAEAEAVTAQRGDDVAEAKAIAEAAYGVGLGDALALGDAEAFRAMAYGFDCVAASRTVLATLQGVFDTLATANDVANDKAAEAMADWLASRNAPPVNEAEAAKAKAKAMAAWLAKRDAEAEAIAKAAKAEAAKRKAAKAAKAAEAKALAEQD